MYAGTTIRRGSGRIVGVHQRIDRAARRHIKKYVSDSVNFPTIKSILYFEGNNGPDGLKKKSPSNDTAWYFINPSDPTDSALINIINNHIYNLTKALKSKDDVRAAFEAAWLAHAVVDGLTPAHHYPLGDKIEELFGKPYHERHTIKEKNIIHGENFRDTLSKNWEYWGAGGVFTTHGKFEIGVASAISTNNYRDPILNKDDINNLKNNGFEHIFLESLSKINALGMYEDLSRRGWTQNLAKQTQNVLIPEIIRVVSLAWYQAIINIDGLN